MATFWVDNRTVQDATGRAVPNASVYYVVQPASNTTSIPPAPLAALATDSTGATSLPNPQVTNGYGQVAPYLVQGKYTVVVVWNGAIQQVYKDQQIGVPQATGNSPIVFNIQTFGVNVGLAHGIRLGANINSGAAILTITSGQTYPFSVSDVGKNVKVVGAGAAGADLYTTILSYQSVTQVTLNANAGTSVTNATAVWWSAGQDVTDRAALNAAIAAATDLNGSIYCPRAFYLYDTTPTWSNSFQSLYGDGIRSTFFVASNASAGSFISFSAPPKWTNFGGDGSGFSVYGPGYLIPAIISNVALTSNVITATVSNSVTLPVNSTIWIRLLTTATGKVLNNQKLTVASSSSTQFTANYTHADITSVPDNGVAYVQESGFVNGTGSMWFGNMEEIEINNFQGAGIESTKMILGMLKRVWVNNCGFGGYSLGVMPPTAVGSTVSGMYDCYALNCYGPGFFGYYIQSMTIANCGFEQCGMGIILDSCDGMTLVSPHIEQIIYRNAALPGVFLQMRNPKGITVTSPFMILDSGGNVNQIAIDLNTTGTNGSLCVGTSIINAYWINQGLAFTNEFNFGGTQVRYNHIIEPYIDSGVVLLSDTGQNNSFMWHGREQTQGPQAVVVTSDSSVTPAFEVQPITLATGGTNKNSPLIVVESNYWNGSASAPDQIAFSSTTAAGANPKITALISHPSGSSGGWQFSLAGNFIVDGTTGNVTALGTISAATTISGGLTVSANGFTVAASQKTKLTTPDVSNSPVVSASNFAISGGWGASPTGPTVQASSYNAAGRVNVIAGGAGITSFPTITFTWTADTNANTPVLIPVDESPNTADVAEWSVTTIDTSHAVLTYKGLPVSGRTYGFAWHMIFRG